MSQLLISVLERNDKCEKKRAAGLLESQPRRRANWGGTRHVSPKEPAYQYTAKFGQKNKAAAGRAVGLKGLQGGKNLTRKGTGEALLLRSLPGEGSIAPELRTAQKKSRDQVPEKNRSAVRGILFPSLSARTSAGGSTLRLSGGGREGGTVNQQSTGERIGDFRLAHATVGEERTRGRRGTRVLRGT